MKKDEIDKGNLLLMIGPSGRPISGYLYGLIFCGVPAVVLMMTGYFLMGLPFLIASIILIFCYFYFRRPYFRIYEKGIDLQISYYEMTHKGMARFVPFDKISLIYPFFDCTKFMHNLSSIGIEMVDGRRSKVNTEFLMTLDGNDPGKKVLDRLRGAMGPQWKDRFQPVPPITAERLESVQKASRFDFINNAMNGFIFVVVGVIFIASLRLLPVILQMQGVTTLGWGQFLYFMTAGIVLAIIAVVFVIYGFIILKRGIETWLEGANLYSQYNEYEEARGLKVLPRLEPVNKADWRLLSSVPPEDGEVEKVVRLIRNGDTWIFYVLGVSFFVFIIAYYIMVTFQTAEAIFLLLIPFVAMPLVNRGRTVGTFAYTRLYKLLKGRHRDEVIKRLKELGEEKFLVYLPRYWSVQSLMTDGE